MKAITIKNPWAYLICSGFKNIENRNWNTHYRGKILIHAGKSWANTDIKKLLTAPQLNSIPASLLDKINNSSGLINEGAIIGEAEILRVVETSNSLWADPESRYYWELIKPVLYKNPITGVKGQLGIWNFKE